MDQRLCHEILKCSLNALRSNNPAHVRAHANTTTYLLICGRIDMQTYAEGEGRGGSQTLVMTIVTQGAMQRRTFTNILHVYIYAY